MSITVHSIIAFLIKKGAEYAVSWAKKDARSRGKWAGNLIAIPATPQEQANANYQNAERCVRIFVDARNPARFVHESGAEYAIATDLISDGGSVPRIAQYGIRKWADITSHGKFAWPFYLHDSGYRDGGLWMRPSENEPWEFAPLTKEAIDLILFQSCASVEGGASNLETRGIYRGVRSPFANIAWKRHQRRIKDAKAKNIKTASIFV